jgi:hypothetical protein
MNTNEIPSDWEFVKEFSKPSNWRLLAHCFYRVFFFPNRNRQLAAAVLIMLTLVRSKGGTHL